MNANQNPALPYHIVEKPVMRQQWRDLTYVHWPYTPEVVQNRLPAGLEVDTFDAKAWVGLVPFHMVDITGPVGPPVPYLGTFPETNIRTYVVGSEGPGVWFDSLDITRLLPVLVARLTYRLPYMWGSMSIERMPGQISYTARRRWPGPRGATSRLSVAIGEPITAPSDFDHFLSARWGLYTMLGKRLAYAPVSHEPWPLHRAEAITISDEFLGSAGYPPPHVAPHVLYSPGVSVRIERPRFVK